MTFFAEQIVHLQAIGSVIVLVGFLIATTLLQQRSMAQSTTILGKAPQRVTETELFASAAAYFERRKVNNVFTSPTHEIPVWFLIVVVLMCSIITYFGAEFFHHATTPSYVLGGAYAIGADTADGRLREYQSGTVFVGSMAFLGAYIWTITRLTNRINNDDMSPITYYFLSVRILTACLVAGVARHMAESLPGLHYLVYATSSPEGFPVGLAVLGFLIGWNPTLWIRESLSWGGKFLKFRTASQRQASAANLPQDMALTMLQGMTDDKVDRLMELDIDNCQKLATENAIILWVRTPYNLELIVDWVAQAQLCSRFEDDRIEYLRRVGVRDIFDYTAALKNDTTRAAIRAILQIPLEIIANHGFAIAEDPAYQRLQQLRAALLPP